jgi:hypothetical protein
MQLLCPTVALLASVVMADPCQKGLKYCAFTLVGKGGFTFITISLCVNY